MGDLHSKSIDCSSRPDCFGLRPSLQSGFGAKSSASSWPFALLLAPREESANRESEADLLGFSSQKVMTYLLFDFGCSELFGRASWRLQCAGVGNYCTR